jgi:Zn-dependent protease with chaperone function
MSSALVERMELDELRCVMAHECGHILCHHTLYKTLLRTISDLGYWLDILSYATFGPVLMAMQYWSRKCEYSADRCAAAVVGEFTFQKTILKLACGMKEISGNPYQLVEQAREYHLFEKSSWLNRLQQNCRIAFNTHPQRVYRAWEIDRWKNSWQYRKYRGTI